MQARWDNDGVWHRSWTWVGCCVLGLSACAEGSGAREKTEESARAVVLVRELRGGTATSAPPSEPAPGADAEPANPRELAPSEQDLPPSSVYAIDLAARPLRTMESTFESAFIGGRLGPEHRARCVDGVVDGIDYLHNDIAARDLPARLTLLSPSCGRLALLDDALELESSAPVSWTSTGKGAAGQPSPHRTGSLHCPQDHVLVGIAGSLAPAPENPKAYAIRQLSIDCAPLVWDVERSTVRVGHSIESVAALGISSRPGARSFHALCESDDSAATGVTLRSSSWLDGLGLECSSVRWPFTEGHRCVADEDCQSGACDDDGTCTLGEGKLAHRDDGLGQFGGATQRNQ
jgi:hypothetical protein